MTVAEIKYGRGVPMPMLELAEWQGEEAIRAEERLYRDIEAKSRRAAGV